MDTRIAKDKWDKMNVAIRKSFLSSYDWGILDANPNIALWHKIDKYSTMEFDLLPEKMKGYMVKYWDRMSKLNKN